MLAHSKNTYSLDKKLNKVLEDLVDKGFSQQDIDALSEEDLEHFRNADSNDIKVCINYYRVSSVDTAETERSPKKQSKAENNMQHEEVTLLTDSEVDDLLDELGEKPSKKKFSFQANPFSSLTTKVKEEEPKYTYKNSKDGYLKQVLYVYNLGNRQFKIDFGAYWLKSPKQAKKDVIGLIIGNATYIQNTASGYTRFYYTDWNRYYTHKVAGNIQNFKMRDFTTTGTNIYSWGDLYRRTRDVVDAYGNKVRRVYYLADSLHISCKVRASKSEDIFSVSGVYLHQETNKTITPSFSISSGGPSASVSVDKKTSYKSMTPNAYISYRY